MADVARAYFTLETKPISEPQLLELAHDLFRELDQAAGDLLPFEDYGLFLSVEEGSLKGSGRAWAVGSALVSGLALFGDFVGGVREANSLGKTVGDRVVAAAENYLGDRFVSRKYQRSDSGDIAALERLFVKVRDREMSPEDATEEAMRILRRGGGYIPADAEREIKEALARIEKHPEQLNLELERTDASEPEREPSRSRGPRNPPLPTQPHLMIVIERSRKDDEARVRKERVH